MSKIDKNYMKEKGITAGVPIEIVYHDKNTRPELGYFEGMLDDEEISFKDAIGLCLRSAESVKEVIKLKRLK